MSEEGGQLIDIVWADNKRLREELAIAYAEDACIREERCIMSLEQDVLRYKLRVCQEELTSARLLLKSATAFLVGGHYIIKQREDSYDKHLHWLLIDGNAPHFQSLYNHVERRWTSMDYCWSEACQYLTAQEAYDDILKGV